MNGAEIYKVLREKKVNSLYHANSVTTVCSFLQAGGLASRGYIKDHRLQQTWQYSDDLDKQFDIWYDVFLDGVDLHERGGMRNNYGPVLFIIPTTILLNLPEETEVFVARKNPVKWIEGEPDEDRYFVSQRDLRDDYIFGTFDQHIIFRTNTGILPFDGDQIEILLDNPQSRLRNGIDAYEHAVQRLQDSAEENWLNLNLAMRRCRAGCQCLTGPKLRYDQDSVNKHF